MSLADLQAGAFLFIAVKTYLPTSEIGDRAPKTERTNEPAHEIMVLIT